VKQRFLKKPFINLMIGTDMKGQGGVATVISTYEECGFLSKHQVRLIITHSTNNRFGNAGALIRFGLAILQIIYLFMRFRVGLVHIHMSSRGSYQRKSLLVRLVKLLKGKVILHLHGGEFRDFYTYECGEQKKRHIRRTFEMVDKVLVLSSHWLAWSQEVLAYSEHVSVLYNAVPNLELNRDNVEKGRIAFLGRIGARKGAADLLRAFRIVKIRCPCAKLSIAGDGEIDTHQKLAQELCLTQDVDFLGWVSGEEKKALLAKTDIYCLPSYNEGFPMGVIEAMSAGIVVVASNVGGIPDAITDRQQGLLIDAGDTTALASSLCELIENRNLNQQYVLDAKRKFDENFSLHAIIPQLHSIYDGLLAK